MKLKLLRYIFFFVGLFLLIIIYLSTVGIETEKFNQQIKDKIFKINKDLDISLKKVNLTLDPFNFKINAKTVGAIIYYAQRPLKLEYIKTQVALNSIIKNKFVSSNFQISTRSILVKDLIRFIRVITNKPELLLLETTIKKGHLIFNLNLNLDQNGKIKKDYEIKGTFKEGKIQFLKNTYFENINFLFNIKNKNYFFKNIKFSSDNVDFSSNLLRVLKINNSHLIEGSIENSVSVLPKNFIKLLKLNLKNVVFENTKFSSKNNFSFEIDRRFKSKNLKVESDIIIDLIQYKNVSSYSNLFPDLKKKIFLKNQNLKLKYENNSLSIKGKGKIKLGNRSQDIDYSIIKNKDNLEFETDLIVKQTTLNNFKFIKQNFPLLKDQIDLKDHKINIRYKDNKVFLNGEGNIKIDKEFDFVKYSLIKNNDKYELKSDFNIKNISLKNREFLKIFFPKINSLIELKNHTFQLKYNENLLSLSGSGQIKINSGYDHIDYFILKEKEKTNFDFNLDINNAEFIIENIKYKKNKTSNAKISISGSYPNNESLFLKIINIKEKYNKIKIFDTILDKNFFLIKFDSANFDFKDTEDKQNKLFIKREDKNIYRINGSLFNANGIITNLLDTKVEKKQKFFKNDINFNINLNEVYLDKINSIKNLQGFVFIKDNKIFETNLSANFESNHKINFITTTESNGEKITKLFSSKAKPFVNRYKFIKGFEEGYLDLISKKKDGKSFSSLKIYEFKLKEMPILTKLLTLASLQGIADILTGEGIRFNELEMNFNNENNIMTIDELYALGPAISILMSGYIEKDRLISLRGTLVPATTINKTVSKIPVLGKILVGDKTGEGIFGVSFKIKGPPKNLQTTVNPIKTLTPRFITRTLEKLKKN